MAQPPPLSTYPPANNPISPANESLSKPNDQQPYLDQPPMHQFPTHTQINKHHAHMTHIVTIHLGDPMLVQDNLEFTEANLWNVPWPSLNQKPTVPWNTGTSSPHHPPKKNGESQLPMNSDN